MASTAAAEGNFALGTGDTVLAAEKYAQAGQAMEKEASSARKASDRNLHRFLAASQYFHGGDYQQALKIARRVKEKLLPDQVRHLFASFVHDTTSRAREGYRAEVRNKIHTLTTSGRAEAALELLKSHPHVFDRTGLAFVRAILCEELKRYQLAALFHASAMKFQPDDPKLAFMSASLPLWLPIVGRMDEAVEYVRYQLEEIGHAVTYVSAAVLGFRRARTVTDHDEQRNLFREVVSFFERAWELFQKLPEVFQRDADLRGYVALCFEVAGFALWRLKELKRAAEVCDAALQFDPSSSGLWTMRGAVRYPDRRAVADLEQAVKLGEKNYYPYYYLAHRAITTENYSEGKRWITEALSHHPSQSIRGQLHGWLAICLAQEGASSGEVERVFTEAREIAPHVSEIEENHQKFRELLSTSKSPLNLAVPKATVWEMRKSEEDDYPISSVQEQPYRRKFARDEALKHQLQPV